MKDTIKYFLELIIIFLLSMTGNVQQVNSQQNDFFPLEKGLKRVYSYQSEEKTYESLWLTKLTHDSGIVAFNVLNDSMSDSILVWRIQEIDSIYRSIQTFADWEGNDTAFLIRSNTLFDLSEKISGSGELSGSSYFPVWQFPWYWPNPFISYYGSPIYRYSKDTLITEHVEIYYSGPCLYLDTLIFKNNIGLIKVFALSYKGPNTLYSFEWRAALIDPFISNNDGEITIPTEFVLFQNYPNPFNPSTQITYSLPKATNVTLKIYDLLGQEIAILVNERKQDGEYKVTWNAEGVPSGVYIYRIVAGEFVETKKMVMMK